jgi:hypothetical protein
VAAILHSWAIFDWAPKIPTVSLCPNHHTYWHEVNRREEFLDECFEELDEDERDNIVQLAKLRDEAKSHVWAEVRRVLPTPPE